MNKATYVQGRIRRQVQGVTVLEMMVTVAVLAIILAIAIPSFQDWVRENELTADINRLQGSLLFARSEAVKRNAPMSVEAAGGDWSAGWDVKSSDDATVRSEQGLQMNALNCDGCSSDAVEFRGDGSAGAGVTFELCSPSGSGRDLTVQPSGRSSVGGDVTC